MARRKRDNGGINESAAWHQQRGSWRTGGHQAAAISISRGHRVVTSAGISAVDPRLFITHAVASSFVRTGTPRVRFLHHAHRIFADRFLLPAFLHSHLRILGRHGTNGQRYKRNAGGRHHSDRFAHSRCMNA